LAIPPRDLYEPLVVDKFEFAEQNYSKEYLLKPKYKDRYEIVIEVAPNTIKSGWGEKEKEYQFTGELKAEFFHGLKKIHENIITDFNSAHYQDGNLKYYKSISLFSFSLPIEGWRLRETKLKLTALKPDKFLEKHKADIRLKVRVSPIP
jgi:hypothetical protein